MTDTFRLSQFFGNIVILNGTWRADVSEQGMMTAFGRHGSWPAATSVLRQQNRQAGRPQNETLGATMSSGHWANKARGLGFCVYRRSACGQ